MQRGVRMTRNGKKCFCRNCGVAVTFEGDCGALRHTCRIPPKPGLGDHVESALSRVGITKKRYKRLRKALGLTKPCGCDQRKRWLNRLGERVKRFASHQ